MILCQPSTKQQILTSKSPFYEKQQDEKGNINQPLIKLTDISIFPCCLEVVCEKNQLKSQNKHHECLFKQQTLNGTHKSFNPVKLLQIYEKSNSQKKSSLNYKQLQNSIQSQPKICSLCQLNQYKQKNNQFHHCLNCQKTFCSSCSKNLHLKGKFSFHTIQTISSLNPQHHPLLKQQFPNINEVQPSANIKTECQTTLQNIKFTESYFNQTYHNEANKLSQLKQNLKKLYRNMLQKMQQKLNVNLAQIQKSQNQVKNHFTSNIHKINKISSELSIFSLLNQSQIQKQQNQLFLNRIQLLQQKLFQIQCNSDQFLNISTYDYKINQNTLHIQQFFKCFDIIKIKRTQQQSRLTQRSSMKSNLKTSRATSRPSSNRMTNSKDMRNNSSFKRNQNTSSNKENNNSSFKLQSNQKNFMKNSIINSMGNDSSRKSMSKSINKANIVQGSCNSSRNNSAFFKQNNLKNVKDLQKAEYQDLNLNLKKLIKTKNTLVTDEDSRIRERQNKIIQNVSQQISQNTSLQKRQQNSSQFSKSKPILNKQNQKSTINSGSFLKIFQNNNKSRVSARKNYLVNSAQDVEQNSNHNSKQAIVSKFDINTSNIQVKSPQTRSKNKKTTIKNQILKTMISPENAISHIMSSQMSGITSSNCSPLQKSSLTKRLQKSSVSKNQLTSQKSAISNNQNYSVIFDNLIMVSCERQNKISQFMDGSCNNSEVRIQNFNTNPSKLSNFFEFESNSMINTFTQPIESPQMKSQMADIQLVRSVRYAQQSIQQSQSTKNQRKQSMVRKNLQNPVHPQTKMRSVINPQTSQFKCDGSTNKIFKDSTNQIKNQKNSYKLELQNRNKLQVQNKNIVINNEKLKKKPDFMDMRQKMRKPNYLSTRLAANNINNNNKASQLSGRIK